MIITSVKIEKFSAALAQPLCVAFATIDRADTWIVKIETDEGIYGLGSAAPLSFVTGETVETCYSVLSLFAKAFVGVDPMNIAGAHKLMDSIIYGNGAAKCAFDIALYDIAGKKEGLPVYRLLGGTSGMVHNDMTIGIDTPEQMQHAALRAVKEYGFNILKIKMGRDLDADMKAIALIRNAVGEQVRLRVDANQGYSVEQALHAMGEMKALHVEAIEQPLPWWDFDGSAALKAKNDTGVALMLDESIHTIYDAKRATTLHCADYFNIKLMKCGGLYYGVQIADIAADAGVRCMVGCMVENKISIAAGVSLVAAKTSVVEADCDSFLMYRGGDDGVTGGLSREGGTFRLLEEPGLGIHLNI